MIQDKIECIECQYYNPKECFCDAIGECVKRGGRTKDLYDIVADKVIEFCKKEYPYDCFVKFEMSYDGKEWEQVSCVVECDNDYHIIFQWDFCEGQKYIRNFKICHTSDAEPVVRCKDCKHFAHDGMAVIHDTGYYCTRPNQQSCNLIPEDYCSYGERKDEVEK